MHLNRACRYPDLGKLFVRSEVTTRVAPELAAVPRRAAGLRAALAGPLPRTPTGPHCRAPEPCPFLARCWPAPPAHHISTLYRASLPWLDRAAAAGIATLRELPPELMPAHPAAARQVRSVRRGRTVVEPGLRPALRALAPPLAFLDFETVSPAVPCWPGCGPYAQVPVQMSCHVLTPRGLKHHAWLARGPGDPRPACARAVIAACAGAATILAYHASVEARCLAELARAVPRLRRPLEAIAARLVDLLAIVRDHVYHPRFGGSFSIKRVLPALVPGAGYGDLAVADGRSASVALEALLLGGYGDAPGALPPEAQRAQLLRYCERDTLGMVHIVRRLHELAR